MSTKKKFGARSGRLPEIWRRRLPSISASVTNSVRPRPSESTTEGVTGRNLLNPDEILNLAALKKFDLSWKAVAEELLTSREPQLHHYPMPKWFYGAYEAVDDAMAVLETYGLARIRRRGAPPKRLQNSFFLTEAGEQAAAELAQAHGLRWYLEQAQLVAKVAGSDSGNRLKERQYAQEAYATARWGQPIGSIAEQVRKRLAEDAMAATVGGQARGASA